MQEQFFVKLHFGELNNYYFEYFQQQMNEIKW